MGSISTIAVAVDFSDHADAAVETAIELVSIVISQGNIHKTLVTYLVSDGPQPGLVTLVLNQLDQEVATAQ